MDLQSYFDQIYCINLKSREDRWEECQIEFKKHQIDGVFKFNAVSGIPKSVKVVGTLGIDKANFNFKEKLSGTVGCLLSHLKIIKDARKRKLSKILILEDDVQFVSGVQQRFAGMCGEIPDDWSLLYFGGNELGNPIKVSDNVIRISNMLMTHAIAINGNFYDELIEIIEKCEWPVDRYYAQFQSTHSCYAIYPYLAWQRAGWSDIQRSC